jgi:hypothetical protein
MRKRKIIATGSLVTSMLLASASPSFAQTFAGSAKTHTKTSTSIHLKYAPGSGASLDAISADLGISAEEFREELRSGKSPRQILTEQGFSSAQIQKIFKTAVRTKLAKKTTPED